MSKLFYFEGRNTPVVASSAANLQQKNEGPKPPKGVNTF